MGASGLSVLPQARAISEKNNVLVEEVEKLRRIAYNSEGEHGHTLPLCSLGSIGCVRLRVTMS